MDYILSGLPFKFPLIYLQINPLIYRVRIFTTTFWIKLNQIFETEIQPQNVRDLIQKMLADEPEQRIKSSVVTQELEQQAEVNIKYYKNLSHILLI